MSKSSAVLMKAIKTVTHVLSAIGETSWCGRAYGLVTTANPSFALLDLTLSQGGNHGSTAETSSQLRVGHHEQ